MAFAQYIDPVVLILIGYAIYKGVDPILLIKEVLPFRGAKIAA